MNNQSGNINWQPPDPPPGENGQPQKLKDLTNAPGALVLGIISLCICPICCCFGHLGALVLSIIGLVLANGCIREYETDPWGYNEKHFKYAKGARITNMIALISASVITLVQIILHAIGSSIIDYNDVFKNLN